MFLLFKRKIVIISSFVSFIIGCTVTISLIGVENCSEKRIFLDSYKYPLTFYRSSNKFDKNIILILILTSPKNVNRRNTIRETWLNLCNSTCNVKHYFVIGIRNLHEETLYAVQAEQFRHRDLLLLPNIVDSYANLTQKVLESYVWIDKSVNFEFVLKCDDDSFIRLDKVISELQLIPASQRSGLYWGFFNGRAQVKQNGKWKEREWFLCDYYLPYAMGGGYVLSRKLVHFIASNAEYLRLYNSEDVSVGVWLAAVSNVHRLHDPRFDTEFMSRGCSNRYLVTHKQDDQAMSVMFSTLKQTGNLCVNEYKNRQSYIYNWNVPPSKCCIRSDSDIP
ncbi:hypothetical protein L9F63_020134 [Diploptera punctata]|uniref:Hexosyltransferase n=1 Tax=Diploptera punctata TaxID=6984 RepID=A0AAD8ED82_DIPPU|nr:hypothetical protein L9F63_020134 [Diploptera punctata]